MTLVKRLENILNRKQPMRHPRQVSAPVFGRKQRLMGSGGQWRIRLSSFKFVIATNPIIVVILLGMGIVPSLFSLVINLTTEGGNVQSWLEGWLQNFSTEMFGAFATFILIELVVGGREKRAALEANRLQQQVDAVARLGAAKSLLEKQTIVDRMTAADLLRGASLQGMNLSNVRFSHANLRGANLERTTLIQADLQHCDLSHANLEQTYLIGAKLISANLSHANLRGANLSSADLMNANLEKSVLWGTNLTGTNLRQARLLRARIGFMLCRATTLPDGTQGYISDDLARFTTR